MRLSIGGSMHSRAGQRAEHRRTQDQLNGSAVLELLHGNSWGGAARGVGQHPASRPRLIDGENPLPTRRGWCAHQAETLLCSLSCMT